MPNARSWDGSPRLSAFTTSTHATKVLKSAQILRFHQSSTTSIASTTNIIIQQHREGASRRGKRTILELSFGRHL